jgi:hypothetical protein
MHLVDVPTQQLLARYAKSRQGVQKKQYPPELHWPQPTSSLLHPNLI